MIPPFALIMKGDSSKRLLVLCIEISSFTKLTLRYFCYYLLRFVQKRKSWHAYVASTELLLIKIQVIQKLRTTETSIQQDK